MLINYKELKNQYRNEAMPLGSRVVKATVSRNYVKAHWYYVNTCSRYAQRELKRLVERRGF